MTSREDSVLETAFHFRVVIEWFLEGKKVEDVKNGGLKRRWWCETKTIDWMKIKTESQPKTRLVKS
jgi:hypothetical protein